MTTLLKHTIEGYTTDEQRVQIASLIREYIPEVKRIMEIGFNAGHSADAFLKYNEDVKLVSFDIGTHNYVRNGKEYIDEHYPERHTLIIGDSTRTVPQYESSEKFDIIFIDGGHDYPVAKADIDNCARLAHEKTLVIVDDIVSRSDWVQWYNRGPNRAWKEAIESGLIRQLGSVDISHGRGMTWGHYNSKN